MGRCASYNILAMTTLGKRRGRGKPGLLRIEIRSIILVALGLLLALSIYTSQGAGYFGAVIGRSLTAFLGFGAYALPFVILFLGIFTFLQRSIPPTSKWVLCGLLGICVITLISVATYYNDFGVLNGGMLGSFLGNLFLRFLGRLGTYVVITAAMLITLILLTGQPFSGTVSVVSAKISKMSFYDDENISYNDPILVHPVAVDKEGFEEELPALNAHILENSRKLELTLKSFGIEAKVQEVSRGPTVTRYEVVPGKGVKVSKISNLADDLALSLAAVGVRIEAPIPGKSAVGIEVPNHDITTVYLRDVLEDPVFSSHPSKLAVALGKDIAGNTVVADIAKMPHLLIAGATGSGKSVCMNTIIASLLYKASPEEVRLLMIDPKVVELSVYNGIPHLMSPVVTDPEAAAEALQWAVKEMNTRYKLFAESSVRDLEGYNSLGSPLPQIVILIDELSDLMMAAPKEVEGSICRLAQMARAAGLHLIIATQRPSVDVITGLIKANIPSRLAFAVSSGIDSRTILDTVGAERLLGKGDMLFYPVDKRKPMRVQGAFISDKEVENIVHYIKKDANQQYEEVIKTTGVV